MTRLHFCHVNILTPFDILTQHKRLIESDAAGRNWQNQASCLPVLHISASREVLPSKMKNTLLFNQITFYGDQSTAIWDIIFIYEEGIQTF